MARPIASNVAHAMRRAGIVRPPAISSSMAFIDCSMTLRDAPSISRWVLEGLIP